MNVDTRRPRRTQAQRSAEMRERLLDATIGCLVDYGYAATTTARIVAQAGVTRGAQLHHFRSKEDLVVAAIAHLAQQRARAAIGELRDTWSGSDPVSAVLDFLWESHQGPMFVATIELWVAARTDPVLVREVKRVEPIVIDTLASAITQLLPNRAAPKKLRNAIFTAMDTLRGILIFGFVDQDQTQTRRRWERACLALRPVVAEALTDGSPNKNRRGQRAAAHN